MGLLKSSAKDDRKKKIQYGFLGSSRSGQFTQSERVMKHIFIMCKVAAKAEFRRCRPLPVLGFRIFNNSTKKIQ